MKTGYARVSIAGQDLTAQREQLIALGVDEGRIHVDHGLTGTDRPARPGLDAVCGGVRISDVLVVTKPDRLLFNVLGMVAEVKADLMRMRTREGMAVAKARGTGLSLPGHGAPGNPKERGCSDSSRNSR